MLNKCYLFNVIVSKVFLSVLRHPNNIPTMTCIWREVVTLIKNQNPSNIMKSNAINLSVL